MLLLWSHKTLILRRLLLVRDSRAAGGQPSGHFLEQGTILLLLLGSYSIVELEN